MTKQTPKEAVRSYCTQCLGLGQWNRHMVADCQGDQAMNGACPLYPYRMGKRLPVSIFRKYCLYCTNGDRKYVEDCPAVSCPAYSYRFGKNPAKKGQGASGEQMKKVRESRKKHQDSIFSGEKGHGASPGKSLPPLYEKSWIAMQTRGKCLHYGHSSGTGSKFTITF